MLLLDFSKVSELYKMETGNSYTASRTVTSTNSMLRLGVLVLVSILPVIDSACTFPPQLTGTWVRSRDSKSLTLTSNTVSGLAVQYNSADLGDFSCDTLSSNRYIIASSAFNVDFGQNKYYICWQFVRVSDNSFIMYELSDDFSATGYDVRPGVTQNVNTGVDASVICPQTTSTTLFTTLVKDGASESDVASTCPTSVQAHFQYSPCTAATLQACTNTKYITADYTTCNTQVFGSAGGVVSCMGSAVFQGERYVNLYLHDSGNNIICWKIPDTSTAADMSTTYYAGDCTTTGSGSTSLDLVLSEACSSDTDSDSGGGGGGSAGAIAGGVVGGIAVIALVVLLVHCLLVRGKKSKQVADGSENKGKETKENGVNSHHKVDIPEETKTEIKIPEKTPTVPSGLPPIESNCKIATGEALRG